MEHAETMSWYAAQKKMINFNRKHGITSKGAGGNVLTMVAVISQDSFTQPYTEEERSYRFTNHNKGFIPENIGNSIFADCLDGKDLGVRLDLYIPFGSWKVDGVYVESVTEV